MEKDHIELITQQLNNISIRKIKIKNENDEYKSSIKKYNIKDYDVDDMEDSEREYEMSIIDWNLDFIDRYENDNPTEKEVDEFISFNLAKTLQYKIKFCLNIDDEMYQTLNKIQKQRLKIIGQKINNNIPLLKNKGIHKKRKIHHIKKLSRAIKYFINDTYDEYSIEQITTKMRKIKIRRI